MKSWRTLLLPLLPMALALAMFTISAKATTVDETLVPLAEVRDEAQITKLHERAWFLACVWSRYSCSGLARPYVVYEPMTPGLYGYYWRADDTVYLSDALRGDKEMELVVLAHEMVHYLQYNRGAWEPPFTKASSCGLEEEAFNVMAKIADAVYGRENYNYRRRGWDAMRAVSYGCSIDYGDA